MDMHFIAGTIIKSNRPSDDFHTFDVKLLNGDTIENVPLFLPVGTDEARFGYVMIDCGVEVLLMKFYGSDWRIFGELSVKRLAFEDGDQLPQHEVMFRNVTDALTTTKEAFIETMSIAMEIANTQTSASSAFLATASGLKAAGGSVAGVHPSPLSNASAINSSAGTVLLLGNKIGTDATKTKADIQAFLQEYPPRLQESIDKQKELFPTNDC
jgi:hypothetical protein